jgi:penicillin-binding protein-related factor A (putative recombinase)
MKLSAQAHRRLVGNLTGNGEQAARNTANRQEGEAFEKRLDDYHAELMATNQAQIMRTNPKIRMTGPGRAAIVGKGECDYVALLSDGRVVTFDAKSRASTAFSISSDFEHQMTWLRKASDYGHTAGLLVYWKDYDECRWHSVQMFDKRVRMADGVLMNDVEWLYLFAGGR